MLTRAARRHLRPRPPSSYFVANYEKLYLPWLCPAVFAGRSTTHNSSSTNAWNSTSTPRKRRNSKNGPRLPLRRNLATAVHHLQFDDIPFEGLPPPMVSTDGARQSDSAQLSDLKPFDINNPLVLGIPVGPERPRLRLRMTDAIGGDISEIYAVLEACLRVGKIERAGAIIRRLAFLKILDSDELLRLHNEYLNVSVEKIMETQSVEAMKAIQKWFEVEIRNKKVSINAETIAYMLKASLQTSDKRHQRQRLVQRLMDLVPGEGGLEVLAMTDILAVEELNTITQILPEYKFPTAWVTDEEALDEQIHSEPPKNQERTPATSAQIRSVKIKGMGLTSLRQALAVFGEKPKDFDSSKLTFAERRARQVKLEEDSVQAAVDRWREENRQLRKMGLDTSLQTKSLGARMWRWQEALVARLREELLKVDASEEKESKAPADVERCIYGPFLRYLPVEKLSAVTILSVLTTFSSQGMDRGVTLSAAILELADTVEEECISEELRRVAGKKQWEKFNVGKRGHRDHRRKKEISRQVTKQLAKLRQDEDAPSSDSSVQARSLEWPLTIKLKVGAFLMSTLIETAKIPVIRKHPETGEEITHIQPAFSHGAQYRLGKRMGIISANRALVDQFKREPVHCLLAKHLPMVVEPEPWVQFNQGGFISQPAKVMRIKQGSSDQRNYAEAAIERGDMDQMFKGLDVLGKTSWRINRPVYNVMLEAWNAGEALANFPPANPQLEVPPEPATFADPTERRKWLRSVKAVENMRGALHSQRCFQNFQLEVARAFLDETFYFPHNVDFRGRAYPIPPYLNHMGADHCRGLLTFGKGKELGANGLRWLRIHLANVYGFDKASLNERENFAIEHEDDIFESANKPLNGRRWWLKGEDPWQCLAACFEIKSALESGDPSRFVSHLPVHQDGTCNGLQHYAALGGDEWGAKQVNLIPGDRPADVYTAVAELVKNKVSRDAKDGNEVAKILEGKITRKVVKQTVMTNVYGVTFIGARDQVKKQLVAAQHKFPNEPNLHIGTFSSYVALRIFEALSTMFKGAHDIQYWLGECANRISMSLTPEQLDHLQEQTHTLQQLPKGSKAEKLSAEMMHFKSSVIWTSPLRMPVVQPYRSAKGKTVTTNLQSIRISEPHRTDPVAKRKQLQGFPPNFVHSLDATHMILSALKCDELGLSFAAVHDSFWTHAASVESMNEVLRDAFIRMHSDDVIGRLAAEFGARYKSSIYLTKIKEGTKFYDRVAKWRKAQRGSKGRPLAGMKATGTVKLKEALLECRRMRLLASSDPLEVAEGKRMVTPGSIFEEIASEADLDHSKEVTTLGAVSPVQAKATQEKIGLSSDTTAELGDQIDMDDATSVANGDHSDSVADEEASDDLGSREDRFAKAVAGKTQARAQEKYQWAWLPLTFPAKPEKGSFDVAQLMKSEYFFS